MAMGSPSLTCWLSSTCQLSKTPEMGASTTPAFTRKGRAGCASGCVTPFSSELAAPWQHAFHRVLSRHTSGFLPVQAMSGLPAANRQQNQFQSSVYAQKRRGNEIRLLQGSAVERKNACQPFYFEFSKSVELAQAPFRAMAPRR